MIKYIGSKRRLVPVLGELAERGGARTALDLFTGTTRVAQEFKRRGADVTAVDTARYSEVFAQCYIETDASDVDTDDAGEALAYLDELPGEARLLHRDLLRAVPVLPAIQRRAGRRHPRRASRRSSRAPAVPAPAHQPDRRGRPGGLDDRRADGLREAVGAPLVQAAGAAGARAARRARARASGATPANWSAALGEFDLAYLDPPYNQHRYFTNYHIWETLVAWDAPEHYGVACKRVDSRDAGDQERLQPEAADAGRAPPGDRATCGPRWSSSRTTTSRGSHWKSWSTMCSVRGHVRVLAFDSKRYVGAQIGIYNPSGEGREGVAAAQRRVRPRRRPEGGRRPDDRPLRARRAPAAGAWSDGGWSGASRSGASRSGHL